MCIQRLRRAQSKVWSCCKLMRCPSRAENPGLRQTCSKIPPRECAILDESWPNLSSASALSGCASNTCLMASHKQNTIQIRPTYHRPAIGHSKQSMKTPTSIPLTCSAVFAFIAAIAKEDACSDTLLHCWSMKRKSHRNYA